MVEGTLITKVQAYPAQLGFIKCPVKYPAFAGGRGSGKSVGGALKALLKCYKNKGMQGLVTAPDYNRLSGSTLPTYEKFFPPEFITKVNKNDFTLETIFNNKIYFRSTTEPQTLRGYSVGFVHMDEGAYSELEAFNAVQPCLRGLPEGNQLWVTTTPNIRNPLNWVYKLWHAGRDDYEIFTASLADNVFTGDEFKEGMKRELAPELLDIEYNGLFMPISETCYFDSKVLQASLKDDILRPIEERINGAVRIFKKRGIGTKYVAGIDVAEGKQSGDMFEGTEDTDYSCLRILDHQLGFTMAMIHARMPLEEFALESFKLSKEYDFPFLGVEINFNKYLVDKLLELGYPEYKMYRKESGKEIGWRTTEPNRRVMLSDYSEAIRDRSIILCDEQDIMEHLAFTRNKEGRPEAARNAHDDYVIAGAIAHAMRNATTYGKPEVFNYITGK